jgi:hypothetical protein
MGAGFFLLPNSHPKKLPLRLPSLLSLTLLLENGHMLSSFSPLSQPRHSQYLLRTTW